MGVSNFSFISLYNEHNIFNYTVLYINPIWHLKNNSTGRNYDNFVHPTMLHVETYSSDFLIPQAPGPTVGLYPLQHSHLDSYLSGWQQD